MSDLVEIKKVDREFYERRIRDFLPERIVDIHTHVWRDADCLPAAPGPARSVTWPSRVAKDNPIEDLLETYRLMAPGKQITPLIFATIPNADQNARGEELARMNAYVSRSARENNVPALCFTDPAWDAEQTEAELIRGGFLGAKSYLALAPQYLPRAEIRILDFFPPHQLEVFDRRAAIVMLHIPRDGRLRDPVNLAQMLHIERTYPNIKLIIAHVGRAYCNHDVGDAFEVLGESERMLFDISANTNAWVFERLIRAVGPKRILFGSDMPVLRMRMRRMTEDDHYVNVVPRGLYGDVSGDRNMAEADGQEAEKLTFFLYEEIDAFRRAAEATGLTAGDVEDVFHNNAMELLTPAAPTPPRQ